jgi:hypothetical protein
MTAINLKGVHDLLVDVAHEAGRMMLAATPSYLSSGTKKNCGFKHALYSPFPNSLQQQISLQRPTRQ